MEVFEYFQPLDAEKFDFSNNRNVFGNNVKINLQGGNRPDMERVQLAIIGIAEERGAISNKGCAQAPDNIRTKLYNLKPGAYKPNIVDLGNLKIGHTVNDTYHAFSEILSGLIRKKCVPIIIGGSQDLTYAQYVAYKILDQVVNIAAIDSRFDIGDPEGRLNNESYLGKIIMQQPNYLFNYSNIGYQTYFVGQDAIQLMEKLHFESYRVGQVRADMEDVEPIVRNADMISFDIGAVRQSDAPGNENASPNGFYGEEICQIARYAGLSDKLSSVGFYETNPRYDRDEQTSHLVSQMIWYFIEGYCSRKKDLLLTNKTGFVKYRVAVKNTDHEIIFYKSKKTDRWWMEVPYPDDKIKLHRHHIVPCSYKDYQTACEEEMPERWWLAFQRLS